MLDYEKLMSVLEALYLTNEGTTDFELNFVPIRGLWELFVGFMTKLLRLKEKVYREKSKQVPRKECPHKSTLKRVNVLGKGLVSRILVLIFQFYLYRKSFMCKLFCFDSYKMISYCMHT